MFSDTVAQHSNSTVVSTPPKIRKDARSVKLSSQRYQVTHFLGLGFYAGVFDTNEKDSLHSVKINNTFILLYSV